MTNSLREPRLRTSIGRVATERPEWQEATAEAGAVSRVDVGGVGLDRLTEVQLVRLVAKGWKQARGGSIVTPNVDIWRQLRGDVASAELVARAHLVVADGMPLVWASRIAGTALPERIAGSSLVERLCSLAACESRSAFVIGGGVEGAAEAAAQALAERHRGLRIVGVLAPPFGFEHSATLSAEVLTQVRQSAADLVLVGLGFPKQERLAEQLLQQMPQTWFLGCGGGIAMAAGFTRRCPPWAQRLGVEWMVRLWQEPRRLAHRYLIDDLPAAVLLLAISLVRRFSR